MPKRIALTFDDGPNDPYTLQLLDVLDRHNVKATFFLIGFFVSHKREIVKEIVDRGHTIANHTFSHADTKKISIEEFQDEVIACELALNSIARGKVSKYFRFPFLSSTPEAEELIRSKGLIQIGKTSSGGDWEPDYSVEKIYSLVKQYQGDHSGIILLHDGFDQEMGHDRSRSIMAADWLIADYKSKGFEFVATDLESL